MLLQRVASALAISVFLVASDLSGPRIFADEMEIFREPPSPQHLADILFAPRYRSASPSASNKPNRFGMMINFEHDSTKVLPESLPMLDSIGKMLDLESIGDEVLVIEGHTDATGTERYNDNLSVRRAKAIKSYLVSGYDIHPERLVTIGYGEIELHDRTLPTNPINRRVEFRSIDSIVIR